MGETIYYIVDFLISVLVFWIFVFKSEFILKKFNKENNNLFSLGAKVLGVVTLLHGIMDLFSIY